MPKETIYRATDPAGGHHYRGSERRVYTHAILRCLDGKWAAVAFAGRPDLAAKAVASEQTACANRASGKWGWAKTPEAREAMRASYAAAKVIAAPVEIVEKRGA